MRALAVVLLMSGCGTVRIVDTKAASRSYARIAIPTSTMRGRNEFQLLHDGCVAAAKGLAKTVVDMLDGPDLVVGLTFSYNNVELGSVDALLAALVDPFAGTILRAVELNAPASSLDARDAGYRACKILISGKKE